MSSDNSSRNLRKQAEIMLKTAMEANIPVAVETGIPDAPKLEDLIRVQHELQVHQIELEMQNDELSQSKEALEQLKDRYFDLYDTAPVGYLTLDKQGVILEANLTAATMLDVVRSTLINKSISQFISPEDRDYFYRQFRLGMQSCELNTWEIRMLRQDNSMCWVLIQARRDKNNEYRISLIDHTLYKQAELQLKENNRQLTIARERAESANEANIAKSLFLTNMSHEIRTPVNGVICMAQLLELTELTQEQQKYVNTLKSSGRNLVNVISDILDLSKIESQKIELEKEDFDLQAEIAAVMNMLFPAAKEKGLELSSLIEPDVPLQLNGDALRLCQIVSDLVNNAIKFTAAGSVLLRIRKEKENGQQITLRIIVQDSGIGIAADKLEIIFAPFNQADNSSTRTYGGTGLGLTISRKLAGLMGGELHVESREGEGSTFWFNAVLDRQAEVNESASDSAEVRESPVQLSSTIKIIHILLVEDDLANQFGTKSILNHYNYQVDVANNGKEALIFLEQKDYDLILMDCSMPVMDGYQTSTAIRNRTAMVKNHAIPIIALTANSIQEDLDRCLTSGMNDYLTKPILIASLLAKVEQWIAASA